MPREEKKLVKTESLGHVVKVQQVIDFIVLSELQENGRQYASALEQKIIESLGNGVGVNDAYLSTRLKKLAESGHVLREWDNDNRYNRFYEITSSGREYFHSLLKELPERVARAQKVYNAFDKFVRKYDHVNLR